MHIKMLNAETINKIAAGEVIVRPVSVIKELVENAMDAGATRITVAIEGGGKTQLTVTDNGCGIAYNEVPLAFCRHATSKILSIDDLNTVETLGFRGEALSSIAAVARVKITTRVAAEEVGSQTYFEDSTCVNQRVCNHEKGTIISVSDLFYNVPARQKHLNKSNTEGTLVQDLMEKLALSHPEIAVTFMKEGNRQFSTPGSGSLKDVIECLMGRAFFSGLTPLDVDNEPMTLKGYIGGLTTMKGTRDLQIFYINGRYVKNKGLSRAFEEAYEGYLMQHKHPVGVVFIHLPGHMLDVNIHPAKTEVAILNESLVHILFKQGIRQTLKGSDLSVNMGSYTKEEEPMVVSEDNGQEQSYFVEPQPLITPVEKTSEASPYTDIFTALTPEIPVDEGEIREEPPTDDELATLDWDVPCEPATFHKTKEHTPKIEMVQKPTPPKVDLIKKVDFSDVCIVGQLFNTFVLLEKGNEAILIDQHAAHEAFMFEELSRRFEAKENFPAQPLLVPQPVMVSPRAVANFTDHQNTLARFGFECDVFGDDTLLVRSVPIILGEPQDPSLVTAFLDTQVYDSERVASGEIKRIITMSCKAAVKGNHHLDDTEIKSLLSKLETLNNPFTCPHGRPIIFRVSEYELEKLFKRVV